MTPRLVLASRSPRRLGLLRRMGLEAEVVPADIDESVWPGEAPADHVERLAREKALVVARTEARALVIGGDTVVVLDGRILGKPADADHAVAMLLELSGRTHEVLSGVAVAGTGHDVDRAEARVVSGVGRTRVHFRELDEASARAYVATGEPLDKAGAYGIQERGAALVAWIHGDHDTVVGLPVGLLIDLLALLGWRYAFDGLTAASDA